MYNEERFLRQYTETILAQDYPADRFEVLLVDGGSRDRTREIAGALVAKHPNFRLLDNPERFQPQARNVGIRKAKGDIICVTDVHAAYPRGYVRSCVEAIERHGAWCVGGTWSTQPGGRSYMAKAIAVVQSHPFGVGNAWFRTGATEVREVDALAFPTYQKAAFREVGLYNELVPRHEDVELFARIQRAGGKVLLVPAIQSTYYARASLGALAQQAWQTGYETLMASFLDTACTRPRHWIPGLFMVSVIVLAVASIWFWPARWLLLADAGAYLLALLLACLHVGVTRGWKYVPGGAVGFAVHHVAYGLGTVVGVFGLARKWRAAKNYRHPVLGDEADDADVSRGAHGPSHDDTTADQPASHPEGEA